MRKVTFQQKLTIYFSVAPHLIGEFFLIGGVIVPILTYPQIEGFFGILFSVIGWFFVNRKVRRVKRGSYVLENGAKTVATVSKITNTSLEHNGRTVKEYTFQYEVNGRKYHYEYRSAYRRHIQTGNEMTIYFQEDNPKVSFIPRLHNLWIR